MTVAGKPAGLVNRAHTTDRDQFASGSGGPPTEGAPVRRPRWIWSTARALAPRSSAPPPGPAPSRPGPTPARERPARASGTPGSRRPGEGGLERAQGWRQVWTPRRAMETAASAITPGSSAAPSSIRRTAASTTPWSNMAAKRGCR